MHIPFNPDSFIDWYDVFIEQARQSGSGFRGYPYQRGASGLGGVLSKFFSFILPIAKSAGRSIACEAVNASEKFVDGW